MSTLRHADRPRRCGHAIDGRARPRGTGTADHLPLGAPTDPRFL